MDEPFHSDFEVFDFNEGKKQQTKNKNNTENQLLAIISDKEYVCYAIKICEKDYLMFIDNDISYDLLLQNENMIVLEDGMKKSVNLNSDKNEFFQLSYIGLTATLIGYYGYLNKYNIILYYPNYFMDSNNKNSYLRRYSPHLREIEKRISKKGGSKGNSSSRSNDSLICSLIIVIFIVLIALGIIFPSFGNFLLSILFNILQNSG